MSPAGWQLRESEPMEDYADIMSTIGLIIVFIVLALHFWERRTGKRNRNRGR
jgi:hypothetical protein